MEVYINLKIKRNSKGRKSWCALSNKKKSKLEKRKRERN